MPLDTSIISRNWLTVNPPEQFLTKEFADYGPLAANQEGRGATLS